MNVGYAVADSKFDKKAVALPTKLQWYLADWLVHRTLRDHLGLAHMRNAYTGGSAIGPDHFRFFHAIGVNLKQIYGQTEIAGISVLHRTNDVKMDTVGNPMPETEVKIAEDGEILVKGPGIFKGYFKNPEATAQRRVKMAGSIQEGSREVVGRRLQGRVATPPRLSQLSACVH